MLAKLNILRNLVRANTFRATILFLYPMKTSENRWFCDVFRGYRKRPVAWNGITAQILYCFLAFIKKQQKDTTALLKTNNRLTNKSDNFWQYFHVIFASGIQIYIVWKLKTSHFAKKNKGNFINFCHKQLRSRCSTTNYIRCCIPSYALVILGC